MFMPRRIALAALILAFMSFDRSAGQAPEQVQEPTFSIGFQGPTIGRPDTVNNRSITEGDILMGPLTDAVSGPQPPPVVVISGGWGPVAPGLWLPMHGLAVGHAPGVPGCVEVDALSYGRDAMVVDSNLLPSHWAFSVDEFAVGIRGTTPGPAVWTEGPAGMSEASADVFLMTVDSPPIAPRSIATIPHIGIIDGNGLTFDRTQTRMGIHLFEPNPPLAFNPLNAPDVGDTLDALDVDTVILPGNPPTPAFPVYYSLDATFYDRSR
jgi:hypothetical protein